MTRVLLLTAGICLALSAASFGIATTLGPVRWTPWWMNDVSKAVDEAADNIDADDLAPDAPRAPREAPVPAPGRASPAPSAPGAAGAVARDLIWPGGHELKLLTPARVHFIQGPQAKVTVIGPADIADRLAIDDGALRFSGGRGAAEALEIAITAPDVDDFVITGAGRLTIEGYDQRRLEVKVLGSGSVTARGKADAVDLLIAGSGGADLGGVQADRAEVKVTGSGGATIAPRSRAEIHIIGSGNVRLTTAAPKVETQIVGSGQVIRGPAN